MTTHIPRTQIDQMFAQMKANAPWDLSGDLLWGYFFTSSSQEPLKKIEAALEGLGYKTVSLRRVEVPAEPAIWQLHVERVEHHSPDTPYARNEELYALADKFVGADYDGMDVGPVE